MPRLLNTIKSCQMIIQLAQAASAESAPHTSLGRGENAGDAAVSGVPASVAMNIAPASYGHAPL
jgi:hypothetical protein